MHAVYYEWVKQPIVMKYMESRLALYVDSFFLVSTMFYVCHYLCLAESDRSRYVLCRIQIDGLMQERHNSIGNALELRLSCTNPSK